MKTIRPVLLLVCGLICVATTNCASIPRTHSSGTELGVNVVSNFQHIDWMTMDINEDYITYDLDILSPEGRVLLKKVTEQEAKDIALSQAIIANHCDAIFQPRINCIKGKKNEIIRVTVYGRPAKYKKADDTNVHNIRKTTTITTR